MILPLTVALSSVLAASPVPAMQPAAFAFGAMADDRDETPVLSVRGTADVAQPADQLQITIGVVTENREADKALDENSSKMADIIKAIEGEGLTPDEYQTGRFRVQPMYTRRPRNAENDWVRSIESYRVDNTLIITTTRLEAAGDIIQAANKAGANEISNLAFTLEDPRKHRAEAIAKATRNAMRDAQTMANAADVELLGIRSITLDSSPNPGPLPVMMGRAMASESAPAPNITPGDVTLHAAVHIVYEIKSR